MMARSGRVFFLTSFHRTIACSGARPASLTSLFERPAPRPLVRASGRIIGRKYE